MSWAKLDDRFHGHPKVLGTSLEALGLFAIALTYSASYETDGLLSDVVVQGLARGHNHLPAELCASGLWERVNSGIRIHDFLTYNPSHAWLEKERKKARKRMKKHRSGSGNVRANTARTPGRDGTGSKSSKSSVPVLSSEGGVGGFETFYAAYPRKSHPGEARKAWEKIDVGLDVLLAALARQKTWPQWQKDGGQFIPYPASWLNARGWEDEPPTTTTPLLTPRGQQNAAAAAEWLRRSERRTV